VAAAVAGAEASHRRIQDVNMQFYPTVTFVTTLQRAYTPATTLDVPTYDSTGTKILSVTPEDDVLQETTGWNVGAVFSWTIFDGGVRGGNLKAARATADVADAQEEATRRQATVQVAQAVRAVEVAEESLKTARVTRDQARALDRLTRLNYLDGSGTSLDLVVAARTLRQAGVQLVVQEFSTAQAKIGALLALATCDY
jgi:multidrug efflux system outer membrane protein